jgi:hypothetical protein
MALLALWASVLIAFPSGALAPPDLSTIQSAYELEAASGSPLHDKGLRLIEAACAGAVRGRYLCQVTFLSNDDPEERLYFDVVAIVRKGREWIFESGLCKR